MAATVALEQVGGYDYLWVTEPPDELKCSICLRVAREPQQHGWNGCGKVFCSSCSKEYDKKNCPICRKKLTLFKNMRTTRDIEALKMSCINEGCQWVGELGSLETHLKTCEYTTIPCTNECKHNDQIRRKDLDDHLTNDCPRRQYECPHCQKMGEHQERTTAHLDACLKVKVPCPNEPCSITIPRDNITSHLSVCSYQRVRCKYAAVGCKQRPPRKNLKEHEEDYRLHLRVTTKKTLELTTLTKKRLIKFKFTEFQQKKMNNITFYSQPFFTFSNGYKMCICVVANGNGDGKATHVSVYAYLMKGPNDDSLSWPFTGTVTFELLNQLEDDNHHKKTVTFPEDRESSQRVVDGEAALAGYGQPKFISHADLDYKQDTNTQYLVDDTLVFSVYVQVASYKPWLECTD